MDPKKLERSPSRISIDNLRIDASVAFYEKVMAERIRGPQLEGFTSEWLRDALQDPSTRKIDIGNGIDWPVLTLVAHNQDYRIDFFDDHFPGRPAYYFTYPPMSGENSQIDVLDIQEAIESIEPEGGLIVYDYQAGDAAEDPYESIIKNAIANGNAILHDITPKSEAYGMEYGPPKVTHFEAIARHDKKWPSGDLSTTAAFARLVAKGNRIPLPEQGATVLTRALLEENDRKALNEIWDIYSGQFDELVDDHPSLQIQPKEELERMLLDEESFNIAYMEEGKIVALVYFVGNIDKCVWLNPRFFSELRDKTPGLKLAYFPGIVVDKERARQGAGYVDEMLKLIEDVFEEAGMLGMQIVFQCTNVSETYIPKIVTGVISNNGVFEFDQPIDGGGSSFRKTAEYRYRILAIEKA